MKLILMLVFIFSLFGEEKAVVTHHTLGALEYDATVGSIELKNDKGELQAELYYFAYVKSGEENRPVTFCFNGGPGSASVWLHLSGLGPKVVAFDEIGLPLSPPSLKENPGSFLAFTDLVFIDPVSTGFSRVAPGVDEKKYLNVDEDIRSVGELVRLWLTRNNRWSSPKYLLGASYGTTRAVGLAYHLWKENFLTVDGIICVSPCINMQTISYDPGNDLPYALFLPSFTAVAHYHTLSNSPLNQVESFVQDDYQKALFEGTALSDEREKTIADQLAAFTSLKSDYFQTSDLRVNTWEFCKQLLPGKVVSRFDGRFASFDPEKTFSYALNDPWIDRICPAYTQLINSYLQNELGFKEEREYEVLNGKPWDYDCAKNQYLNMSEKLATLMTRIPTMKLFFGCGIYDLATPYFAASYTLDHLFIPKELRSNITMKTYDAGHMFYMHRPSFEKFRSEVQEFMKPQQKRAPSAL